MSAALSTLAKRYEVDDFFYYICDSWLNGNKRQVISLFREMRKNDRKDFMIELNNCTFTNTFGDGPWQVELLDYIINSLEL